MALLNTVLALLASTVITFVLTPILSFDDKKARLFRMTTVPIQNATLAGGVSIGATANLEMGPGMAMIIGTIAGAISTAGFCSPLIDGDVDSCGINNLHGMPGIFGGVMSAVLPLLIKKTGVEPGMQMAGLAVTLVVSIVTGFVTGKILKAVGTEEDMKYSDETFWETADDIKQS